VKAFIVFCVALLVSACVTPVRRDGASPAKPSVRKSDESDPVIVKVEGLRKRIWVLDFRVSAPIPEALVSIDFRKTFRESLSEVILNNENSAYVPVVADQNTLQDLQIDSSTPTEDVSKVARGSGIAGYLRGDIFQIDLNEKKDPAGLIQSREINLEISYKWELVDSGTSRVLVSGTRRKLYTETRANILGYSSGLSDPEKKIKDMARSMSLWVLKDLNPHSTKVGWSGRILKIEGSRVYINAGRSSGIRVGDILKVVENPRDVYDPQSGRYIGQAPGRVKGTAKVLEYFGLDGSIAFVQSGGGLLPGDRVEIF
jgi:hypothetical protein